MHSAIRKMGNSSAIIIPKPLLTEIGLGIGDAVALAVEGGRLVIEAAKRPRAGWAADAQRIAAAGDDELVLGEFGCDADDELAW